ncbi:unnamed protein product, partial [Didymodactylos carnosus]
LQPTSLSDETESSYNRQRTCTICRRKQRRGEQLDQRRLRGSTCVFGPTSGQYYHVASAIGSDEITFIDYSNLMAKQLEKLNK